MRAVLLACLEAGARDLGGISPLDEVSTNEAELARPLTSTFQRFYSSNQARHALGALLTDQVVACLVPPGERFLSFPDPRATGVGAVISRLPPRGEIAGAPALRGMDALCASGAVEACVHLSPFGRIRINNAF